MRTEIEHTLFFTVRVKQKIKVDYLELSSEDVENGTSKS